MGMKAAYGNGTDDLQRISACMIGTTVPLSLAHEAVRDMEMDLLRQGWPVGRALGALPEVQKRLGLGRPASREAVTILEARGLLDVRRGPGGGLFVAAPAIEDVAGAMLMYLALSGGSQASIGELRLLVRRMTLDIAIRRGLPPLDAGEVPGPWGCFADLAARTGNSTLEILVRLAEMLARISGAEAVAALECEFDEAIRKADFGRARDRLESLDLLATGDLPAIALDMAERGFSFSGRKSAMALAARMARELSEGQGGLEAEWETADRLGYTEAVVRQARRILQDFGIVHCRQGRKGVVLAPPAGPTGVIRLMAPCLVASGTSAADNRDAISFLACGASVLAARRAKARCGSRPAYRLSVELRHPGCAGAGEPVARPER